MWFVSKGCYWILDDFAFMANWRSVNAIVRRSEMVTIEGSIKRRHRVKLV